MVDKYKVSPPEGGVSRGKKVVVPMPFLSYVQKYSRSLVEWNLHFVGHVAVPLDAGHIINDFFVNSSSPMRY